MLKVYYMSVAGGCSFVQGQMLDTIILPERMEKINRQRNASSANKQRLISAFMQYVLAKELDCSISGIRLAYGPYGKPQVVGDSKLCFNMSHSGDYVVMAVSDQNVGIDIEGKKKDRLHIAKRFFCPQEYESILELAEQCQKERRFLELWTMKEATVKYVGAGLQMGFDSFLLEKEDSQLPVSHTVTSDGEELWLATHFLVEDSYCVSVCSKDVEKIQHLQSSDYVKITLEEIEYVVSNS